MVLPYLIVSVWTLVFLFVSTIYAFQMFFPNESSNGRRRMTRAFTSFVSTGAGMLVLVLLGS